MNASQRRAEITANIVERTGIDEAMIARLVHFLDSNNRAIRQHRPRLGCGRWFRPTFLAEEITGSKHRCFLALLAILDNASSIGGFSEERYQVDGLFALD